MGGGQGTAIQSTKQLSRLRTSIQDDIDQVEMYENSKTALKQYKEEKGINFQFTSLRTIKDNDPDDMPSQVEIIPKKKKTNFHDEIDEYSNEDSGNGSLYDRQRTEGFKLTLGKDEPESSLSSLDSGELNESIDGEKEGEENEVILMLTDLTEVDPSSPFTLLEENLSLLDQDIIKAIHDTVDDSKLQATKRKISLSTVLPRQPETFLFDKETSMAFYDLKEAEVDCWLSKNLEEKKAYFSQKQRDRSIIYDLGMAYFTMKGRSKESFTSCASVLYYDPFVRYLSLFGGNGPHGPEIANCVSKFLFKFIIENPILHINPLKTLQDGFRRSKLILKKKAFKADYNLDTKISGSTALTALKICDKVYISYVGDILVFVAKRSKTSQMYVPMPITKPHLPKREDERKRIYEHGGEVRSEAADEIDRVYVRGRVYPGLRISRSFGNDYATIIGVRNEPEHFSYTIDPTTDAFMIICTPSLLSHVEIQDVINIYASFNSKTVKIATELVANKIRTAAIQTEELQDDVSFLLTFL